MIGKDKAGMDADALAILYTENWLAVVAAPHNYRALERPVEPAVLLQLLDIWTAYVDRGDYYIYAKPPHEGRPALVRKLRALIEAWTPPELPEEITEAARALLVAEGCLTGRHHLEGGNWDSLTFADDTRTVDSYLIWSEGLPAILPSALEATDEERAEYAKTNSVQVRKYIAELAAAQALYERTHSAGASELIGS